MRDETHLMNRRTSRCTCREQAYRHRPNLIDRINNSKNIAFRPLNRRSRFLLKSAPHQGHVAARRANELSR